MTSADCDTYLVEGRATAAFYLAHAVRIVSEGMGRDNPRRIFRALDFAKAALGAANREGYSPTAKAPLMRVINWLRADLRKMS